MVLITSTGWRTSGLPACRQTVSASSAAWLSAGCCSAERVQSPCTQWRTGSMDPAIMASPNSQGIAAASQRGLKARCGGR